MTNRAHVQATSNIDDIIHTLNKLIQLDYDAIAAYQAAIERLDNVSYREQLRQFCEDHRKHTVNLSRCVSSYGAKPETGSDFKKILTKGKVVLADIAGDKAILKAMNSNEKQTNEAYEKAVNNVQGHSDIELILSENLADERRHKSWIEQTLASLK